jgi:hypothetical protein
MGLWSAAVFVVTGDPGEVLDGYEHQRPLDDKYRQRGRFDGGTHVHLFWERGGGTYTADLVMRPGHPTYPLVEHSPDR